MLVWRLGEMEEVLRRFMGLRIGLGTYSSSVAFPSLSSPASWPESEKSEERDEFEMNLREEVEAMMGMA